MDSVFGERILQDDPVVQRRRFAQNEPISFMINGLNLIKSNEAKFTGFGRMQDDGIHCNIET